MKWTSNKPICEPAQNKLVDKMEQKIDLEKFSEKDLEKYKKMRKVAKRGTARSTLGDFYLLLAFVFLAATIIAVNHQTAAMKNIHTLADYTAILYNKTLTSMNITTNLNRTTNATINLLITKIASNPKALATIAVTDQVTQVYGFLTMVDVILMLAGAAVIFTLFSIADSFNLIVSYIPFNPTVSYVHFKRAIRIKNIMRENLEKHGYTQEEISWFFAVRSALIRLRYGY